MTRPHDMGGRFGDGPVIPDPEGPVFPEDWHGRALALTLAAGALGQWNIDISRHAREKLAPKDYARFHYYEKWVSAMADLLVQRGVVSRDELAGAAPQLSAMAEKRLKPETVAQVLASGGPTDRATDITQTFQPGDAVQTLRPAANRLVNGGHTRLPTYASGACGTVLRCHGAHVLADANAHDLGERPEPLYSVRFRAGELWAQPEHPEDEVILDLWQSYLSPA